MWHQGGEKKQISKTEIIMYKVANESIMLPLPLSLEGKYVDFMSYRDSVTPTFSLVAGKSIQNMILFF